MNVEAKQATSEVTSKKVIKEEKPRLNFSKMRPQKKRRFLLALSFLIMVILPSISGAIYYSFIASDRYATDVGFAIRSVQSGGGVDMIGAFTGLASNGSTTSDSFIVLKYLDSGELIEELDSEIDVRSKFSNNNVDFISRLTESSNNEELMDYWTSMLHHEFDTQSGVITLEVQAYTPEDSLLIAAEILVKIEKLINNLSKKAREDSLNFAQLEVVRAENRLKDALHDLKLFRENQNSINPQASAELKVQLIATLEGKLSDINARISALRESVDENAPSMKNLLRQAEALKQQINDKSTDIANNTNQNNNNGVALSEQLSSFETLEVEKRFAQETYAAALTAFKQARLESDREQRYLAVFNNPRIPDVAIYPDRLINSLLIFICAICIWGICSLLAYSIKDHLA